jgi:hypothetical protein
METINDTYTRAQPIAVWTERCHIKCEMKAPRIDLAVPELAVLSALAALGCGLAAVQGDLWFVAVFSAASAVTIIGVWDELPGVRIPFIGESRLAKIMPIYWSRIRTSAQ